MSQTEKNKQIIARYNKEFIEEGNMETFNELMHEDYINHTGPEGAPKTAEGVLYFFNSFLKPSFSDLKVTIHEQVAEGDKVVTRKSFHATHSAEFLGVPATNKTVEFSVIDIITLKDGKLIEHSHVLDWGRVMQQIS